MSQFLDKNTIHVLKLLFNAFECLKLSWFMLFYLFFLINRKYVLIEIFIQLDKQKKPTWSANGH